jgi:hypothetical protein
MARTLKYSNEQMAAALAKTQGMVYLAAAHIGCNPDTIYSRAKVSKIVARSIANERGRIIDAAELKLIQAVDRGEPWAITLCLKTLGKSRGYVERTEYRAVGDFTDEELLAIVAMAPDATRCVK